MWKTYSRETPGRTGWSLAACIIVFVAVVGLAQYTVNHRPAQPIGVVADSDSAELPFDINLPDDYDWSVDLGPVRSTGGRFTVGTIIFRGASEQYGTCEMSIGWIYSNFDVNLKDLSDKTTDVTFGDVTEIRFGPTRGWMSAAPMGPTKTMLIGVAKFDNDLTLFIKCTVTGRAKAERMFRTMCRSIRPKGEGEADVDDPETD